MRYYNLCEGGRALGIAFGTLLIAGLLFANGAGAATWTVDDSGGANFTGIQDAIDNANEGDTIFVYNGIYYENIIINKEMILQGENKDTTILQATYNTNAIRINSVTNVVITDITIRGGGNSNSNEGGGIQVINSKFTIKNCILINNRAVNGGGISIESDSTGIISNCLIVDNYAANGAGGVLIRGGDVTLINDIIVSNSATYAAGGLINEGTTTIKNSIFWNNAGNELFDYVSGILITYSDIDGGWSGIGNMNENPLFVNPATGDYHLQVGSPCIDTGINEGAPSTDLDGNPRPIDGDGDGIAIVDMDVYEYIPVASSISGFKINDTNGNGVWGVGETGIQGWNITLKNATTDAVIVSNLTDANGFYQFMNLPNGSYNVTEEMRIGFTPTNATFKLVNITGLNVMT